jgi:hypothetical protein
LGLPPVAFFHMLFDSLIGWAVWQFVYVLRVLRRFFMGFLRYRFSKVYDYVSNHSYQFFQNNLTGTIISKVKGINDGCQRKKFPGYFLSYKNNLKNLRFLIKKMEKILIKNKIKKLTFFEKNCFQIFYHGLKALIIEAFSTPHGSRCATQLQSFAPLR